MEKLTLDPVYLDRFLTLSQALHFPTNEAQVRQFVEHMDLPDAHAPGSEWNAFRIVGLGSGLFMATIIRDVLFNITLGVAIPDKAADPDIDAERMDTVFQQATATITNQLGTPTKRKRGKTPTIAWTMPNGGRIRLVDHLGIRIHLDTPPQIVLDGVEAP